MKKWFVSIYLALTVIESIVAAQDVALRLVTGGGLQSVFDILNLIVFFFLIAVVLGCTWLLVHTFHKPTGLNWINRLEENRSLFWGMLVFFSLVLMESVQDLLFLGANLKETYYPVTLVENQSLLIWAALVSGQSLIGLTLLGWKNKFFYLPKQRIILIWLLFGGSIGSIILFSGSAGYLTTNAPVTFLHVLVVILFVQLGGVLVRFLSGKRQWLDKMFHSSILPFVFLWAAAFVLWGNVDLEPNYFIDTPRPPNYEYSPTSDAIFYEIQAQRFLVGEGFDENAQHSFYGYILSGLHQLGGDHYQDIYRLQIALLAIIPFFLYKLTSQLGSRFSGWMLAGLFILRERNALMLGDTITVSNVQELMTEPLATLGVILFIYLVVIWLKDLKKNRGYPFLIGGVIGLAVLVRVELLSLVIVFGIASLLVLSKSWKPWLSAILLMLVALSLIIAPWMTRNYQKTGTLTLDKGVVLEWAVEKYILQNTNEEPGQNQNQNSRDGILQSINFRQLKRIAIDTSNSLQQTLLYLPSNHLPLGGLDTFVKIVPEKRTVLFFQQGFFSDEYITSYTKSLPYWHVRWDGRIAPRSFLPVFFVIITITMGIFKVWNKYRWVGLLPLLVMVLHIIIYAFFIGSGGRYIQVVDWITLLYFCLGLSWWVSWISRKITGQVFQEIDENRAGAISLVGDRSSNKNNLRIFVWGLLLISLGISMPIVESLVPPSYTLKKLELRLSGLETQETSAQQPNFQENLDQLRSSDLTLLYGKALYPNFFGAEEEILDDRGGKIPESGLPRIVFYLVGTQNIWVSLPMTEPPDVFAHGSEVAVLGQITRDSKADLEKKLQPYFLAEQVYIMGEGEGQTNLLLLECDLVKCQP